MTELSADLISVPRPAVPHYRCFQANHRLGGERRKTTVIWSGPERRAGKDRRQDADWRFALIRRFQRELRRSVTKTVSRPWGSALPSLMVLNR